MLSSRTLIINYLERHSSATVRDLSIALHLTPANIRHHLKVLQREGTVMPSSETITLPKGRPAKFFSLVSKIQANNYALLSEALIEYIKNNNPISLSEFYRTIAQLILKENIISETTLTQKLIQAINLLQVMHYEASWEAEKDTPIIKFNHCPYYSIVVNHPDFCELDCQILNQLIGKNVQLTTKLQKIAPNQTMCKFKIIP